MSDALYLHKGGIAPAPASGDKAIVLDADGIVKTVDSDGVKTALGSPAFGSDTIVQLANSGGVDVDALELITALTTNTSGNEASSWTVTVLSGGVQVQAAVMTANGTLYPRGVYDGIVGHTIGGVAVGEVGTGMIRSSSVEALLLTIGGASALSLFNDGANDITATVNGILRVLDGQLQRVVAANGMVADLQIYMQGGAPNDVVIGIDGARVGTENGGYLQIPVYAGAGKPTPSTPQPHTGHALLTYNTTTKKIEIFDKINLAWVETAALS